MTDVTEFCLGLRADEGGGARQAAAGVGSAGVVAPAVAEQSDVLVNRSGGQPQLGQLGPLNRYSWSQRIVLQWRTWALFSPRSSCTAASARASLRPS